MQIQTTDHNPLFDRKIDLVTAGLRDGHPNYLRHQVSQENALVICNYILAMKTEINLSDSYRMINLKTLGKFSNFHNQKPFKQIAREDVLAYLDSLRKPESLDPMHKWIGTYNIYRIQLTRFFKWLYYPENVPQQRPKPKPVENIAELRRKEKSIYKPSDLWIPEEDLLFLRYCPSKRMKCYHAIARDLACRPHEILKLKIKDITFKSVGNRQYAEVVVNGKTGTRPLPLIDSLPYIKDYLDHEHPQPGNPNAVFISGTGKSLGRIILPESLNHIYASFKNDFFPRLLENPNVPLEDKQKIKELLKKPFSPYLIGRHTSLTQKSRILKEATLRVYAGWTANSDMPRRYIHLFGNAACEDILQAYGLVEKDEQTTNGLQNRQCPNCMTLNKHDTRFCSSCRMILSYDAYEETLDEQKKKESEVQILKVKYEQEMKSMREEMNKQFSQIMSMIQQNPQLAQVKPEALIKKHR